MNNEQPGAGELHVVFGAGQVGGQLATLLHESGKKVRVVKRTAAELPNGIEIALGDVTDSEFCRLTAHGAAVIYHCVNPPYDTDLWADLLPRYMDNLVAAAGAAAARLVVLDNLYMLGRPRGKPISEASMIDPCSRKGEIRAQVAEALFEAHFRGDVRALSAHASDFYGPGATVSTVGDHFWKAAIADRSVFSLVDPDMQHTYHYVPDVAAGLAALGCAGEDVLGRAWMLPCNPAGTLRELAQRFAQPLGRPIRLAAMPRWVFKMTSSFVPIVRELDEILYQWEEPFVVDDRRFRQRFGNTPVDAVRAAEATVEWAKRTYGPA